MKNFNYTGSAQTFTAGCNGYYQVALWGAQGGGDNSDIGGRGSYTSGVINLQKNDVFYIYIGQAGAYTIGTVGNPITCNVRTYNGGGWGGCMGSFSGGSGGGSTDIRLVSGNWDNFDSLKSRIMVAAGGAGSLFYRSDEHVSGQPGGGITGYDGKIVLSTGKIPHPVAPAMGQSYPFNTRYYFSYTVDAYHKYDDEYGQFGRAGNVYENGVVLNGAWGHLMSGGGGGYYGGSTGIDSGNYGGSGSSGSCYISGHNGCLAINKSSTEYNTSHSTSSIHYSGKVFINTVMIDGAGYKWTNVKGALQQMPNPSGGYYASGVGHSGNEYARITWLGDTI